MKLFLMIAVLAVTMTGCKFGNDVTCAIEDTIAGSLSQVVAGQLVCAHPEAIEADIKAAIGKLNVCAQPVAAPVAGALSLNLTGAKSAFGQVVCPMAINAVSGLVNAAIPAAWGCTGSVAPDALKEKLVAGCSAIL